MHTKPAQTRFYARRDLATCADAPLRMMDINDQPAVELVFDGDTQPADVLPGTDELPGEGQVVRVNGVERYYWVEISGQLRGRDLREVCGQDLRQSEIRVITTDDARRYVFVADKPLPRDVVEAIPPGPRRAAN